MSNLAEKWEGGSGWYASADRKKQSLNSLFCHPPPHSFQDPSKGKRIPQILSLTLFSAHAQNIIGKGLGMRLVAARLPSEESLSTIWHARADMVSQIAPPICARSSLVVAAVSV